MARAAFKCGFTATAFLLCACGGGGGGAPQPGPNPSNSPPAFRNQGPVTVPENSGGTAHTALATDPDNDPLTFSISGGADATFFRINVGTGEVSLAAPLDFEDPADVDANNVYQVQIAVSDGRTSTVQDLAVTVTNVGPDGFRVARVGTGFDQPLYVTAVPDGTGRVFVVERPGRIRILNPATGAVAATPFLDISNQTTTDGERGLLGFAVAPDFAATAVFYVYLTNLAGDSEVRRYRTLAGNREQADAATGDIILTFPQPFANHNGGWLDFGPDGFLYLGSGDGGSGGDPQNNGQNTNTLLGKILRLDVRSDAFADPLRDYAIPPNNPFAAGGGRPEVWAYGLRNPYRASFDAATGNLWIGDVGQNAVEEIDLMRPTDGGANFGWRVFEGIQLFTGPAIPGTVPPVAEYGHGSGSRQGNSVTGGYVYRGPVEGLRAQYFFGDFVIGNLWSIPIRRMNVGATVPSSAFFLRRADFTPVAGTINNVSSFGVDQQGNLYIVDIDGEIFRIEPA
jgi:glucose/arabinose dehydrogenase